jgi:hypothetical protein
LLTVVVPFAEIGAALMPGGRRRLRSSHVPGAKPERRACWNWSSQPQALSRRRHTAVGTAATSSTKSLNGNPSIKYLLPPSSGSDEISMTIRALCRQEFDRFSSAQATLADFTSKAVEWFADDTGLVLGAVAHHESDLNWSYVVLSRDTKGQFRSRHLQFGVWNVDEARRLLLARMETTLATATTGIGSTN